MASFAVRASPGVPASPGVWAGTAVLASAGDQVGEPAFAGRAGELPEPAGELVAGPLLGVAEPAGQLAHGEEGGGGHRGRGQSPVGDHLVGELPYLLLLHLAILELTEAVLQALQVFQRTLVGLRVEERGEDRQQLAQVLAPIQRA